MRKYNFFNELEKYKVDNAAEYDFILGLGESCFCSQSLRKSGLQQKSLPFDWSGAINWKGEVWSKFEKCRGLERKVDLIVNNCQDILNREDLIEFDGDPSISNHPHKWIRNIKTGLQYIHDFPLDTALDEVYYNILEKYKRRIFRMYANIYNANAVLFVFFSSENIHYEKLYEQTQRIHNFFHKKIDWLFLINDTNFKDNEISVDTRDNIKIIKYRQETVLDHKLNENTIQNILSAFKLITIPNDKNYENSFTFVQSLCVDLEMKVNKLICAYASRAQSDEILPFKYTDLKTKKSVVFVSHEFGLYPGHGGIASYLYNICKWLLENTKFKVSVIASEYDGNTDLLKYENFVLHSIHDGDLCSKRNRVLNILQDINPDYVEFTDYLALGLHCVLDKTNGKNFQKTVLVTNNHTATRECFEWSTKKQIEFAPFNTQNLVSQEKIQLQFSDYCIAPSKFLAKYVQKNYQLKDKILWFMNPFFSKLKTKNEIRKDLEKYINLDEYSNTFNITLITRFEGRKCQDRLIQAFIGFTKNPKIKSKLWLAGNTSYLPNSGEDYRYTLYKKLKEEDRKNIKFFDFLSQKQQEPLIAITDLSVMPSTYENQPMAMIETVLRGIPIIASKYSGCADYLDENMLFDPFDEKDLLNKIQNFYNLSKADQDCVAARQKEKLLEVLKPENCILPRFYLKFKPSKSTELNMEDLYHE